MDDMAERTDDMLDGDELAMFEEGCDYDPLDIEEEKDADEKAETFGYIGTPEEAVESAQGEEAREIPARERIEQLFEDMPPYKRWLIDILQACREAKRAEDIENVVEGLRAKRHCVFNAASFRTMLEEAGALEKLTLGGEPYGEVEPKLEEVEEDGKKYLRPTQPPEAMWKTTPEGLEAIEANDPLDALIQITDEQADYTDVFAEILGMCEGDGASINEIKMQVNTNPVLEYPKKTAQFFMDYLDRNDAIEWDGAWKTTEVGRKLLERLEKKQA